MSYDQFTVQQVIQDDKVIMEPTISATRHVGRETMVGERKEDGQVVTTIVS